MKTRKAKAALPAKAPANDTTAPTPAAIQPAAGQPNRAVQLLDASARFYGQHIAANGLPGLLDVVGQLSEIVAQAQAIHRASVGAQVVAEAVAQSVAEAAKSAG